VSKSRPGEGSLQVRSFTRGRGTVSSGSTCMIAPVAGPASIEVSAGRVKRRLLCALRCRWCVRHDVWMGRCGTIANVARWRASVLACVLVACSSGTDADPNPAGTSASAGTGGSAGLASTGGSSGTGGGLPTTPGEQFLTEYAASVCAMYEPCCNADGLGFDLTGCTSWYSRVAGAYLKGDYLSGTGEACLAQLARALAADPDRCNTEPSFDEATFWDACSEAFASSARDGAALGEKCLLAADCASSAEGPVICYGDRCMVQLRGTEGDGPCFVSGGDRPTTAYTCDAASGLYCDRESNMCAPHAAPGEPCPTSSACDPVSAMCSGGLCYALPGEGEPCLNGIQGAGGYCRPGAVCDRATVTCGPGLPEGSSCTGSECANGICDDGTCRRSDYTKSLNCTG